MDEDITVHTEGLSAAAAAKAEGSGHGYDRQTAAKASKPALTVIRVRWHNLREEIEG